VDEKFKKATDALSTHEMQYHPPAHPGDLNVADRMKKAEKEDNSSSKLLNRLKETFRVREELIRLICRNTNADTQPLEEGPITTVEFLLHKSLPDRSPTIVKRERRLIRVARSI